MSWNIDQFRRIVETPSPSSDEGRLQSLVYKYLQGFGYEPQCDYIGNVYTKIDNDKPTLLIEAHADQVALQIKSITDGGFLKFKKIGGVDIHSFYGQVVSVITKKGTVAGIIGRDPRSINESEDGFTIKTSSMWIDIGAKSYDEAVDLVAVNDLVVFKNQIVELSGGRISTSAGDNKLGVYTILELAERFAEQRSKLPFNLCFATTVQEEIGARGAKALAERITPDVTIIVDVEYAMDFPNGNNAVELGGGVVVTKNADNTIALIDVIQNLDEVNYQFSPVPEFSGSTNSESYIIGGKGSATLTLSIPLRNMHSATEVFDVSDVNNTISAIERLIDKLAVSGIAECNLSPIYKFL